MGLWSYFYRSSDPPIIKNLQEGAVRRIRGACPWQWMSDGGTNVIGDAWPRTAGDAVHECLHQRGTQGCCALCTQGIQRRDTDTGHWIKEEEEEEEEEGRAQVASRARGRRWKSDVDPDPCHTQ